MAGTLEQFVTYFDVVTLAMWAISFLSTIPERALLLAVCSTIIGLSVFVGDRTGKGMVRIVLPTLTSFATFLGLYLAFPFDEYPFPVDGYLFPGNHPIGTALALTLLVGAERSQTLRRAGSIPHRLRPPIGWTVTVIVLPLIAVVLVNGWALRGLARSLHADEGVTRFAAGDFNGLHIDPDRRLLFASGHGTDNLLAFDLASLETPARRSQAFSGAAQSFAYNKHDDELYIYNVTSQALLFLDASSLALKRTAGELNVAPGDIWVDWEPKTDLILLSSESEEGGVSTVLVDRPTGKVVEHVEETLANTLVHPRKPIYYMGLHERILAFDLERRGIVATFDPGANWFMQRMAMGPGERELLVAATASSAILRFDPDSLELRGRISTVLGVRTLAVDAERHLLLTASLVSNMLDVIDLKTEKSIGRYYVGPWLRTIVVDPELGQAYVSSIDGLFRIDYARSNPGPGGEATRIAPTIVHGSQPS
jgi:hypothetical protein